MIGDLDYFANLIIQQLLPGSWFGAEETVINAIAAGLADPSEFNFTQMQYIIQQTRLDTSTDDWLDIFAKEFLGQGRFLRRSGESDVDYRARIKTALLRKRGTRLAMVEALTDLTGKAPIIIEPNNVSDTGGWGAHGNPAAGGGLFGWGVSGCWGSRALHHQCFVTAFRPPGVGIPNVNGWGGYLGGWGVGSFEWATAAQVSGPVVDQDIYNEVVLTQAAGTIAWTKII
jgi:hypothetical protein